MPSLKYALPAFLKGRCTPEVYLRWLSRKAVAHVKRDRKRGNTEAVRAAYMTAIHAAVVAGGGADFYTGEPLAWEQISTYRNDESKAGRRAYKRQLAMLPTVDHVGDGLGPADFKICALRTNDCKSDLTYRELIAFSRLVLAHHQRGSSADPAEVVDDGIVEAGNIAIEECNLGRVKQIYEV
jgi:hypothetical protein